MKIDWKELVQLLKDRAANKPAPIKPKRVSPQQMRFLLWLAYRGSLFGTEIGTVSRTIKQLVDKDLVELSNDKTHAVLTGEGWRVVHEDERTRT